MLMFLCCQSQNSKTKSVWTLWGRRIRLLNNSYLRWICRKNVALGTGCSLCMHIGFLMFLIDLLLRHFTMRLNGFLSTQRGIVDVLGDDRLEPKTLSPDFSHFTQRFDSSNVNFASSLLWLFLCSPRTPKSRFHPPLHHLGSVEDSWCTLVQNGWNHSPVGHHGARPLWQPLQW